MTTKHTRWAHIFAALLALAVAAFGCGTRLPGPTTGPHPAGSTNYVEVPYPPPAARVEVVPPHPREANAVWVDGEWSWQGKRWVWLPGGWVAPPPGAYFAPWLVYRLDNGRLLFAPGAWHATKGEKLPNPLVLEAARNGVQEEGTPPEEPSSSPVPATSNAAPPASSAPSVNRR